MDFSKDLEGQMNISCKTAHAVLIQHGVWNPNGRGTT